MTHDSSGGSHSLLSLKGKPRFCIFTEDKLAKKRFNPPVGAADIQKIQDEAVPKNTRKDTAWSVKVHADLREARSKLWGESGDSVPLDGYVPVLSPEMPCEVFDFWLQRFVLELKWRDGSPYPAISLKHLCVGIQRHMCDVFNHPDVSLFE